MLLVGAAVGSTAAPQSLPPSRRVWDTRHMVPSTSSGFLHFSEPFVVRPKRTVNVILQRGDASPPSLSPPLGFVGFLFPVNALKGGFNPTVPLV